MPVTFLPLPLLFVVWHLLITIRGHRLGLISLIAVAELVMLCLYYLYRYHPAGTEAQGAFHVYAIYLSNLAFWVAMVFAYRRNQDDPGPLTSLACHVLLFCWLGWAAFPWPGASWRGEDAGEYAG